MRYPSAILNYYDRIGHRVADYLLPGVSVAQTEKELTQFRRDLGAGRVPGPRPRDSAQYASQFPNRIPDCLIRLYAWRNGTRHDRAAKVGHLRFLPAYYLMSLRESLRKWAIVTDAVSASELYENENTAFLGASLFPFMHDSTGNYVVLDVNPCSSSYCTVGTFAANGLFSRRNEFRTLSRFFKAHYQCCREGIYRLDDHGLTHDWKAAENVLDRFREQDA